MKRFMNRYPNRWASIALGMAPMVILMCIYLVNSEARLTLNPNDKLMPAMSSFVDAMERLALEPSKRSGEYVFWQDTLASLQRLTIGVMCSAALGLIFGLGEFSKVMLIVIGIAPFLMRDLQNRVSEIPKEILVKAQTLGASTWQIASRVVLPQVMPRLLESVRLSLGPAWLFLIAAEAIASTEGLGYRIFLVRRYLSMDIILPYVAWITLLAYSMDWFISTVSKRAFPWFHEISRAHRGEKS